MSIYSVRLKDWYGPGDSLHSTLKFATKFLSCPNCKKKNMHWQDVVGDHSIVHGYGDMWCREKCQRNYFKKRRK